MATFRDSQKRLNTLLDKLEAKYRRDFRAAIVNIKSAHTLTELADLIEQGRIEQAIDRAVTANISNFASSVNSGYILAADESIRYLSDKLNITVSFDQVNIRAVAAMRDNQLRLVREFSQEQRDVTRNVLIDGIQRGENPRVQAIKVRDNIGLTARQQSAVKRYRELLESNSTDTLRRKLRDRRFDRTIQRAIDSGEPLTQAQIDKMVARYQERYIKYRSEVIARTEALRSANQGTREGIIQAVDQGAIDRTEIKRTWDSSRDARVRPSHVRLHGLVRGLDETFPGDDGPILYPGDPNAPASETIQCRCLAITRI